MNAFEEFCFGDKYVLRFYRVDNGLICDINESMVPELRKVEAEMRQQEAKIEALKKTINSLFGGLEASLDLNKAQAIRKALEE